MPFTKLGPDKYKSPSGRIWTKKQVIAYHASGGFRHKRRVRDALPVDPTNTIDVRNAFREEFNRRWRKVDSLVREAVVDKNSINSVAAFSSFIDTAVKQAVTGEWPVKYVRSAYNRGVGSACMTLQHAPTQINQCLPILADAAISETQGIAAATVQQTVRAFTDATMRCEPSMQAYTAVKERLVKVGEARSNMLVDWSVKRAYAEATLDTFSAAGVKQVGIDASGERRHFHIGDARKAEVIPRGKRPSPRQRNLIQRREAKLNRLGEVNVQTAEDDRVCMICENIAEDGPYDIDRARGLIPAHNRCRCLLIPVE
jgi:hypothetical protein